MSRTIILWAGSVGDSFGGGHPEHMLGEPDGNSHTIFPGTWATLSGFRGRFYVGFSELLSGVIAGDRVTPAILAAADLVAFEGNGGSPAPSGGWESCDWYFSDGVRPGVSVSWDEATGAVRDPRVLANGSVSGAAYSRFFGFPVNPANTVVSFLLFRLSPEVDPASPFLKIRVSGTTLPPIEGIREGSPDPDAIGILACHHEDEKAEK